MINQMSKHFTLAEMTKTSRKGLQEKNRKAVTPELYEAGERLCEDLLEPIREHFKKPITISSGFRCLVLNKRVRGAANSQHCKFEAADFIIDGVNLLSIFDYITRSALRFGQVILEPRWIHISLGYPYRSMDGSGEMMVYDGKKYTHIQKESMA
mgnify:FL=1